MRESNAKVKAAGLQPSNVYVRIRPQTMVGGHAQVGQPAAAKILSGWDTDSVFVGHTCDDALDAGRALETAEKYKFKGILPPDCTQTDVYDTIVPPIVDQIVAKEPNDALFFAYGQTGCGKTHTMLGPDASLREAPADGSVNPDWGVFPRVAYDVMERLQSSGRPHIVTFSAVEYYMFMANDLLSKNAPVTLSQDSDPIGLQQVVVESASQIIDLMATARRARHTRETKMNLAGKKGTNEEHGGSSRGHAMFLLTVYQLDPTTKKYVDATFNMVDLAGAERPDKTGAQRLNGAEVMSEVYVYAMSIYKGTEAKLSTGAQAFAINFELKSLLDEASKATDFHRINKGQGKLYNPGTSLVTDSCRIMGKCMGGSASLTVVVTLSQAPQCGWETWFSCKYGQTLSKLKAPTRKRPWVSMTKTLSSLHGTIAENEAALSRPLANPRVVMRRNAIMSSAKTTIGILRALASQSPMEGLEPDNKAVWGPY